MRNRMMDICKCILFIVILVFSLSVINRMLEPKYIQKTSTWPTTATFNEFYKMENNSIDVLFLGSSVVVNAFIPQEIYNDYGIRSYNLGSEQQSVFLSYYWLEEALRYQKPQIVVLDMRFMNPQSTDLNDPNMVINTSEALTRKSLTPMKWSRVKQEAVHELCKLDNNQSEFSYYLTNIRFHSRWTEIKEQDLDKDMVNRYSLKGFGPIVQDGPQSYNPFEPQDFSVTREFVPLMQEYLDKTVKLCQNNGIKLVLIDLPGNTMNDSVNNAHIQYAARMGIDYYNLCNKEYYDQIGATLPKESAVDHQNIWGAIKTSRFMGKLLQDEYGIKSVTDDQYESSKLDYENTIKSANLIRISDPKGYLQALANPNYAVFMSFQGQNGNGLISNELHEELRDLGLESSFDDKKDKAYVAAIVAGDVLEEKHLEKEIEYLGNFRDHHSLYSLKSGKQSSIIVEGTEYSRGITGLNIVVYDLTSMKVIDRVTIQGNDLLRS